MEISFKKLPSSSELKRLINLADSAASPTTRPAKGLRKARRRAKAQLKLVEAREKSETQRQQNQNLAAQERKEIQNQRRNSYRYGYDSKVW